MAERPPSIGRRTILKRGLLGGAVLLLAGAGLTLIPGAHVANPTATLEVLDDRAFQVLVAVAQRVVTMNGADPVAIAQRVDRSLTSAPPETQADLVKLLHLFDSALAGAILDRRPTPFTRRSAEDQDATLLAWRDSSLAVRRSGYQALRKLCLVAHWSEEESFAAVPYAPPAPGSFRASAYPDSKWGDTT
ncbi:hypothetical protein BH09MYX1_BH09MYX1_51520 [soil metagenome]